MSPRAGSPQSLTYMIDPGPLAPELEALRNIWLSKRGDRPMPDRAEIDPFELRPHLAHIALLDVLDEGVDFRYRLLGTAITERFARDSTGRTVSEVYGGGDPEVFQWVQAIYRNVVTSRLPVLGLGNLRAVGKEHLQLEVLNLPFSRGDSGIGVIMSRARFIDKIQPSRHVPVKT